MATVTYRRATVATVVLALATTLLLLAMAAYPGGSASSPHATSFVPWRDYLCDLLAATTMAGRDNSLGMVCARGGMVLTGVALWLVWHDCSVARPWPRRHSAIRIAGACAALMLPLVACSPSGNWPMLHSVAILFAGLPGGLAIALVGACVLQRRREYPRTAALSVLFGLAGCVTAVTWTLCFFATWPGVALANAQKVAWVLLVPWALALARE